MTKDEKLTRLRRITSDQTIALADLINENKNYKDALANIQSILFSIGGPLNDNVHQYSKKQLVTFINIKNEIQAVI